VSDIRPVVTFCAVGGAAAGNLTPVPGYFQAIRQVCDKYGVLLILDEIMCGMGRTGKMHAWEWEGMSARVVSLVVANRLIYYIRAGIVPDIQTIGKGLNGGYMALSAVLMQDHIYQGLRSGSGAFANGQTFQCHPAAAMAGLAVLKVFKEDHVIENCRQRGEEVRTTPCEDCAILLTSHLYHCIIMIALQWSAKKAGKAPSRRGD
jgi:adenosylmethionine-8-amino-7-oxononanoate aminotransferase